MHIMEYQTLYDVSEGSLMWLFLPIIGLAFALCGLLILKFSSSWYLRSPFLVGSVFVGIGLLWTVFMFLSVTLAHLRLTSLLKSGRCQVLEGVVESFKPMPLSGHGTESFVLNGKRFEYSDYVEGPGFHQTRNFNGPIKEGIQIRISYVGDDIARLEVLLTKD